jgi:hypothetical protein
MKIKRIRLDRLRNEEWFNFFTEFKTFVNESTPATLRIEELFLVFLALYDAADDLLEVIRRSSYTSVIVELDSVRDRTFRGLREAVISATHHFDAHRRQLAESLLPLFDNYGDIAVRTYNEETASIYNFVQELRGAYAPVLAQLALTEWAEELERNNVAFEDAILGRNQEAANKNDLRLLEVRRQTGRAYLDIVERIEAAINLYGSAGFEPFVRRLNANIERYQNTLNRRKANNSGNDKDKPVQTETTAEA